MTSCRHWLFQPEITGVLVPNRIVWFRDFLPFGKGRSRKSTKRVPSVAIYLSSGARDVVFIFFLY